MTYLAETMVMVPLNGVGFKVFTRRGHSFIISWKAQSSQAVTYAGILNNVEAKQFYSLTDQQCHHDFKYLNAKHIM